MLYKSDNAHLMARHVAKFHAVTLPDRKVIGSNKLHFKPILTPLWKKMLGDPILCGVRARKTWPFYGACKNFGAQHPLGAKMIFRISRFSGCIFT